MPTAVYLIAVFFLPAILATASRATVSEPISGGPAEPGRQEEMRQLQDRLDQLTKQIERMQEEDRAQQERIGRLQAEIQALKGEPNEAGDEVARLRALAEGLAGPKKQEKSPEETIYKSRGLSLQQLNPEISVSGDLLAYYRNQDGTRQRSDVFLRALEVNFQSYLDPFSKMKATLEIDREGQVEVEEAYYSHFTLIPGAILDLGRFRQQFGVVNRWHGDALDQVQYPLVLRQVFGEEGLHQTGASVEWSLPEWAGAHHGLTLQVTSPENERLFDGDTLGTPSLLFHYKNYRDLSRDTYLEFGLSGLFGWSDEWDIQVNPTTVVTRNDALGTRVLGADLSVLWEPADRALYRNIEWRSEAYVLNRDILAPDGSGRDTINAWGAYSYLQSKIAQNLIIGVRGDYYEPASKDYAILPGVSLVPLAYPASHPYCWQVGPYITWWQSEWVLFRVEYDYAWGNG
ncbi:MAG: hypothetical protein JW955_01540, partial [Sedimentisphaerales bacterium]|nr:hypothetical protein [Sedimentisphaerales bacterium]